MENYSQSYKSQFFELFEICISARKDVIPRAFMPVGIRSLLGITDCHAPSVLAMTTGTKHFDKSGFNFQLSTFNFPFLIRALPAGNL